MEDIAADTSVPQTPPNRFRGLLQGRTRVALAWIFSIILIVQARQYPSLPGISLCFLGATIRFWASGYLRKDNRLTVSGPYALTRNPLYLGTYLMAIGTALSVEAWVLAAVITVVFGVQYHYVILDEEVKLAKIFGAPYEKFMQYVPRFFPRLWPANYDKLSEINANARELRFSWELAKYNKAHEAYVTFIALIGAVTGVAYLWQKLGNI